MLTDDELIVLPFWEKDTNKILIHFLLLLILFDFPFTIILNTLSSCRWCIVRSYYASIERSDHRVDLLEDRPRLMNCLLGLTWTLDWVANTIADSGRGMGRAFWRVVCITLLLIRTYMYIRHIIANWDLAVDYLLQVPDPVVRPAYINPEWFDPLFFQ